MYDEYRDKGADYTECVQIPMDFLNLAFAGGRCVVKCSCKKCRNYKFLFQDDIQLHLCNVRFMPKYLVWHGHEEVRPVESDGNDDEDRMNGMIADIGRKYDLGSRE
jgi:hypothetical protein